MADRSGQVGIAVVGAGLVGRRHVEMAGRRGCLSALVDPAPGASALARTHDVPHFPDIAACLADLKPAGAIIATPNHLHVSHAKSCIEAGVAVLIEKPIADRSAPAADLVAFARDREVPILVGHHRRHNTKVAAAARLIENGGLGRIVAVTGQFWLYKPDGYFEQTWRQMEGAGPIFINLIHDIDLLRHLCGEIAAVQAIRSFATRGFEVEDSAAILLEFESGALGTFSVSDTVVAPWSWEFSANENPAYPFVSTSAYKIGGTEASLSVPDLRVWRHPDKRGWWEPIESETIPVESSDALERQLDHFLEVCRGAPPLVSGAEGLQSLRVIEAIIEASKTRSRVSL